MLLGKILAESAMHENKHVTWLPSYGAEVRGGTAHCMVVISDDEIGSPYVTEVDALIVMNEPSLERFKNRITKSGLIIANSSLMENKITVQGVSQPFTDIAERLGNVKVANMVALGCFLAHKKIVAKKSIVESMVRMAPNDKKHLVEINIKALEEGTAF